jgi:hypothetical protein
MNRFGYSIFCDDIRNEPGGKLSFVGCYNSVIFVPPEFPLVLPKLCVHIHILTPASQPYNSIVVRCYAPGRDDAIFEEPVEPPERQEQIGLFANLPAETNAPPYIVAGTSLIFTPFHIRTAGLLRVRAVVDDAQEEIRLGSLRIEANA